MIESTSEIIDEDEFLDSSLSEAERRRSLEIVGRIAASIEIDLADKGPLYLYLKGRRTEARAALAELASCDPNNPAEIVKFQSLVNEYLRAANWVRDSFHASEQADQTIREEFNGPPEFDQ